MINRITLALLILYISGCAEVTVGVEEVTAPQEAADLGERVHIGITSRDDLNQLIGHPVASSENWKLELYRIDKEDDYYTAPLVLPIPMYFQSAIQTIYVLVTYDRNWKVSEFDTGYYVKGVSGIRCTDFLRAEAGGFQLKLAVEEHCLVAPDLESSLEWLYAPSDASRAVIDAPPQKGFCTIYLATSGVNARLIMDSRIIMEQFGYPNEGYAAISAIPGQHELKVLPISGSLASLNYKGESKKELECQEGQRLFIEINTKQIDRKSVWERHTIDAEFVVQDEPSPAFKTRRLILYHNGKWLGPDKPNS